MTNNRPTWSDWPWLLAVVVLLFGLRLVWAKLVYDDWSCAVAECRKVKP